MGLLVKEWILDAGGTDLVVGYVSWRWNRDCFWHRH